MYNLQSALEAVQHHEQGLGLIDQFPDLLLNDLSMFDVLVKQRILGELDLDRLERCKQFTSKIINRAFRGVMHLDALQDPRGPVCGRHHLVYGAADMTVESLEVVGGDASGFDE